MRYFDHNATHPVSAAARTAWLEALDRFPANPSSPHRWGARAATALEEAKEKVAQWLGGRPQDLVWTSGATEANNAVLRHLGTATRGSVLLTPVEHPSILAAARRWLETRSESIPVSPAGVADVDWIRRRLGQGGVAAVVVMAANNETGVIQPWSDLRDLGREFQVPYICDAAQWVGKMPGEGLGSCEFLTACGHKFGGPQGVGVMRGPAGFDSFLVGGAQEDGRRAGTENVAGILAMVAALEERERAGEPPRRPWRDEVETRIAWRDRFAEALKRDVPGVVILGEQEPRLWNTVAALMPPAADCRRRWVAKLDMLGFAVSTGSACASGKELPSHVLAAMGRRPEDSDRMLRFSAGWETQADDWTALLEALKLAAAELQRQKGNGVAQG